MKIQIKELKKIIAEAINPRTGDNFPVFVTYKSNGYTGIIKIPLGVRSRASVYYAPPPPEGDWDARWSRFTKKLDDKYRAILHAARWTDDARQTWKNVQAHGPFLDASQARGLKAQLSREFGDFDKWSSVDVWSYDRNTPGSPKTGDALR